MTAIDTIAKALTSQSKDDAKAEQKENRRMKLAPFKTRYEPFSAKTLDELRGWQPPGGVSGEDAYILFEKKSIERGDIAPDTIIYNLHPMLVGSRPEQKEKIRYNVEQKGMKIIHWDRFPKVNDSNPFRARLAAMHYNPQTRMSAYDTLEAILINYAEGKNNVANLQAQLEAANELNASLQDKLQKKRDKDQQSGGAAQ